MKKKNYLTILIVILLLTVVFLPRNNEDDGRGKNTEENMLRIVFLNHKIPPELENANTSPKHELKNHFIEDDVDALYAFKVGIVCYYTSEDGMYAVPEGYPRPEQYNTDKEYRNSCLIFQERVLIELMQQEGFMILHFSPMTIAGTMEDIERVFKQKESLNGWYLKAESAVRPDIDVLDEDSKTDENQVAISWDE